MRCTEIDIFHGSMEISLPSIDYSALVPHVFVSYLFLAVTATPKILYPSSLLSNAKFTSNALVLNYLRRSLYPISVVQSAECTIVIQVLDAVQS